MKTELAQSLSTHSMVENYLISIIIPVYNAEKLLADCIDSILNQTVNYWNLILVDDGSTDNSNAICNEFAKNERRINVISQRNGGPGKARNTGIDACTTEWFTFVDADDKLSPDYLANFHIEKCTNRNVLSCQGYKRVDLLGNELEEKVDLNNMVYKGKDFLERAFRENNLYNFGQSVGKLYNKFICDENHLRLNAGIRWSEDHLFYLQYLMYINEIHTHSGTLYLYQLDEDHLSLTHRDLPYTEALDIFRNIYSAADALVQKYALEKSLVIGAIRYHSVVAGFSNVIRSLYREEKNKSKRLKILESLRNDMKRMRNQYNAHSFQGMVIKYMLLYVPLYVIDTILKIQFSR